MSRGDQRVRDRLAHAPLPDEDGARARARRVAAAAFEAREPAPRPPHRPLLAAVLATVLAAVLLAVGLTAPGDAVGDWVRRLVAPEARPTRPALDSLPAAGRLLVSGTGGAWVVRRDGSRRRLGPYADAAWSPRGLFVAVARGRQLLAVDPRGSVRWALARPSAVRLPRWSPPDGFRIAYLSGRSLRVVAGDGSGDRLLAPAVVRVAPAWRPGVAHQVAYVDERGRVVLAEADSGRVLWRRRAGSERLLSLEWSGDGERLMVAARLGVRLLDVRGGERRRLRTAPGSEVGAAALSPTGDRVAVLQSIPGGGRDTLVLHPVGGPRADPRVLFSGPALRSATWSPDGRWLLVTAPGADQWIFVRVGPRGGLAVASDIARQFDPRGAARAPRVEGWCCPPGR